MNRFFLTLLAVFIAAASSLPASQVRTFQDAQKKAGDRKPFIMFCYGANYDKYSEKIYDEYIKRRNHPLGRILTKEIFVVVPIFQLPSDKEKREFEKVMGKRGVPGGIRSYPCFAVLDGQGRVRGVVESGEDLASPEKTAEALSALLEDYHKQEKLLDQASRAKGDRQKSIMREALALTRVRVPNHGTFDPSNNGLGEKLQVMSLEQANAHVRNILANGAFTLLERQMILVALAGHMRRNKAPIPRLRAIYTEIRNIDPSSTYGIYAEGALELWVIPHEGETKTQVAPDGTPR